MQAAAAQFPAQISTRDGLSDVADRLRVSRTAIARQLGSLGILDEEVAPLVIATCPAWDRHLVGAPLGVVGGAQSSIHLIIAAALDQSPISPTKLQLNK